MVDIFGAARERHREMLEKLAEFCGFDAIKYVDKGNGEEYVLYKKGETITLIVARDDKGGFMLIDYGQSRLIADAF